MSKTVWGNGVSMVERRTKRGVPRSWDPVLCPVGPWHSVQAQMEQLHSMNKEAAAAACISTGQSHGWEAEMCVCIDKKKFVCGGQEGSLAEHSPGILEVLGELSSTMSKTKHNRSRNK